LQGGLQLILLRDEGLELRVALDECGHFGALGRVDLVVASLNPPRSTFRLSERSTAELAQFLDRSLLTHLRAAKALVPRLGQGAAYVAIAGTSSDFAWPEHGHISVNQAAQRMLFRVLAQEYKASGVSFREYVIAAMVHDGSGAQGASAAAIGDDFARLAAADFGGEAVVRFPRSQG